jgi:hypothetical protein
MRIEGIPRTITWPLCPPELKASIHYVRRGGIGLGGGQNILVGESTLLHHFLQRGFGGQRADREQAGGQAYDQSLKWCSSSHVMNFSSDFR